jgi:hypothetical protein
MSEEGSLNGAAARKKLAPELASVDERPEDPDAAKNAIRCMLAQDKLDSQSHIYRCQQYILACTGMDMNLSEIEKTPQQASQLLENYHGQVAGFASAYFSFQMDKFGGGKGASWLSGKDLAWFEKRLIKTSSNNFDSDSNNVDGQYLMSQWETVLALECPEFNDVTSNGTSLEISGENIWMLLDRIRPMCYEKNMDRTWPFLSVPVDRAFYKEYAKTSMKVDNKDASDEAGGMSGLDEMLMDKDDAADGSMPSKAGAAGLPKR